MTAASNLPSGDSAIEPPVGSATDVSGPSSALNCINGRSTGRVVRHAIQPKAAVTTTRAATAAIESHDREAALAGGAASSSPEDANTIRASPIAWRRRLRSLVRHRRTNLRIATGVAAVSASQSGSSFRTLARVSETDSPSKALLPTSISYRTAPNDQMSARLSTDLPLACSGDI